MGLKVAKRALVGQTTKDVDGWIAQRAQSDLMLAVRKIILETDTRVGECIKWSCPTFTFEGNIVSINPAAKSLVSLMFHTGGKIPGDFPQLVGEGATCKYMRIEDAADLKKKKKALQEVVRAWIAWKS